MTSSRQDPAFLDNKIIISIAALIVSLITIIIYLPALQNGFVNLDDPQYISNNTYIQSIDLSFIKWMFTSFQSFNWHPLTWLSHAIDYAAWGLDPMGHHLTSILFHGLNTFLVVILITRLVRLARIGKDENGFNVPLTAGVVTGLLFGLHPVHVESVAWVSERKDLLCAFFFLLSTLSYLKYSSLGQQKKHYILCLLFFILALMSKPMAVTLPVVFIILDLYPLERLSLKQAFSTHRRVLIEKLPFFVLSLASSVITVMAQQKAMPSLELFPFGTRICVSIRALGFYLTKMVLPTGLAPLYQHPREISFVSSDYIFIFLLVTAIVISCFWLLYKKQKFWPAAWAYYLVTLLPVLGIIQVGEQAAADRYTYLPSLGPFILAGTGTAYALANITKKHASRVLGAIAILLIILGIISNLTIKQTAIWENSITLWNAELKVFPNSYRAHFTRGNYHYDNGYIEKAIEDFNRAVEINPQFTRAYYNRAIAYEDSGNYKQALMDYSRTISLKPDYEPAYINRGIIYAKMKSYQNAIKDFTRGITINSKGSLNYYNRGLAYEFSGNNEDAYKDFQAAARLGNTDAQNKLKLRGISW